MTKPPGSVEGDTVYCYHQRGGCKCLEKLIELARTHGTPVYMETQSGRMKLEPKDQCTNTRTRGDWYTLSGDEEGTDEGRPFEAPVQASPNGAAPATPSRDASNVAAADERPAGRMHHRAPGARRHHLAHSEGEAP